MNLKELAQDIINEFLSLTDRLFDKIPQERRQLFILCFGGLLFLAILFTLIALVTGFSTPASSPVLTFGPGIPAEELFYPREPDFLPPLLLEREPNMPWTIRDLEFFWQDPRADNEDKWRDLIKTAIDNLMDGVP